MINKTKEAVKLAANHFLKDSDSLRLLIVYVLDEQVVISVHVRSGMLYELPINIHSKSSKTRKDYVADTLGTLLVAGDANTKIIGDTDGLVSLLGKTRLRKVEHVFS